jgi:hypothetical protein
MSKSTASRRPGLLDHQRRDLRPTQVAKTLWPGMPGTSALLQKHGQQLVCVRYRHAQNGTIRYTTIELLVSEGRVRIRPKATQIYGVKIDLQEPDLSKQAKALGAKWDRDDDLWKMSGYAVLELGLVHRIRKR